MDPISVVVFNWTAIKRLSREAGNRNLKSDLFILIITIIYKYSKYILVRHSLVEEIEVDHLRHFPVRNKLRTDTNFVFGVLLNSAN